MNLATYISTLEAFNSTTPVVFAHGGIPTRLVSWRGSYDELSLDWDMEPRTPPTVEELLADARNALEKTFTGYKGGQYRMHETTPIWADPWGECLYNAITGFSVVEGNIHIAVNNIQEYR
jgi:hypothetical protein